MHCAVLGVALHGCVVIPRRWHVAFAFSQTALVNMCASLWRLFDSIAFRAQDTLRAFPFRYAGLSSWQAAKIPHLSDAHVQSEKLPEHDSAGTGIRLGICDVCTGVG